MHNRYPLVRNDIDDYAGILYAAEILGRIEELQNGEIILDDLDHYDMAVPPQLKISELIDRFQSNKQELALVIEDEKVQGLVTLTDAVEVIIGSAEDPIDKEKGQPDNH
jgi:CBS domain containing-hemolysin-like protein